MGRAALRPVAAVVLTTVYAALCRSVPDGPALRLLQLLTLVPAILLVAASIAGLFATDMLEALSRRVGRIPRGVFLGLLMIWAFAFPAWMALGPMDGIPKGGDETAYLFQSRVFASGRLWAEPPGVEDPGRFFPFRHFIFDDGRWFIMYTPLHALVMAPFSAAGLHSLTGPLEGSLSILGAFLLLRLRTGERRARASVILMGLSPFFLFMTASRMAHNTSLLLVTWGLYLLSLAHFRDRPAIAVPGGFLLGMAVAAKPYPDIAWWALAVAAILAGAGARRWRMLSMALLGAIPAALFFLAGNLVYTGNPFETAYGMARGGGLIGFGPDRAWFPVYGDHAHTPLRGLLNLAAQAGTGSVILFGWPLISLVPAAWAMIAARGERRRLWAGGAALLFAVLLSLHYSPSVDYGPRHWYTLLPWACALSVLGLSEAARRLRLRSGPRGGSVLALSTIGLFVFTAMEYMPPEIGQRSGTWQAIDDEVMRLARLEADPPAVIFMEASEHGYPNIVSGMNHLLTEPYLFCAHQTASEDMELMALMPHRGAYLYWNHAGEGSIAPWTPALAESLVPSRDMAPDPSLTGSERNRDAQGR